MSLDIKYADQRTVDSFRDYVRYLLFPGKCQPITSQYNALHFRNYSSLYPITSPVSVLSGNTSRITTATSTALAYTLTTGNLVMTSPRTYPITGVAESNFTLNGLVVDTSTKYNPLLNDTETAILHAPFAITQDNPVFTEIVRDTDIYEVGRLIYSTDDIYSMFSRIRPLTSRSLFMYNTESTNESSIEYTVLDTSYSNFTKILSNTYMPGHPKIVHPNVRYVIVNLPEENISSSKGTFSRELLLFPLLQAYDKTRSSCRVNIVKNSKAITTVPVWTSYTDWEGIPRGAGPRIKSDMEGTAFSYKTIVKHLDISEFMFYPEEMEMEMMDRLNNLIKNGRG